LLIAVIESRLKLPINQFDVYLNIIGGLSIKDPAIDLAIIASIISAYKNKPLPSKLALIGEVGLLGEIRPVTNEAIRLKEAKRLGYTIEKFNHLNDIVKILSN